MTPIYHITHIQNLQGIISAGGIHCDRVSSEQGLCVTNIAYQHIKERRAKRQIQVSKGGTLWDYVPFYFCPRSPMLYANHKGIVPDYHDGQIPIIHLVSIAEEIRDHTLPFFFTDGHAEIAYSIQYDDLNQLNKLDWAVINATYWADTPDDYDRVRRKQSEFLVYQFLPWNLIKEIGVINQDICAQVLGLTKECQFQPVVSIQPKWYY